ncbi:exported protein A EppA [Borreliella lanei]|uniref:Uncharacterized protein n=1 Tax=Borreliella lanei TaxID=373540 RepID=A0A7W9ZBP2_9SPIR|nr:hypothetical protein [Borreliella lanei]
MCYIIKNKLLTPGISGLHLEAIICLIDGEPARIFYYLIQIDSDKIDYTEKYGEKARDRF